MSNESVEGATGEAGTLLAAVVPNPDVRERHEIWIPVAPDHAFAAVKAVTTGEVRLFRPLMLLRLVPALLRRERIDIETEQPLLEQFLRFGFVELGERPGEEIAFGAVARFWSIAGNRPHESVRTREDFVDFDEPGFSKAAANIVVRPDREGARVSTETRIVGTSPQATKLFARYWRLARPGAGVIRRSWLSAIRRRALRGSAAGRPWREAER